MSFSKGSWFPGKRPAVEIPYITYSRRICMCSFSLTSSIMVSTASDNSALVASLATMFLSLRQYSLSYKHTMRQKLQSALPHPLRDTLVCDLVQFELKFV